MSDLSQQVECYDESREQTRRSDDALVASVFFLVGLICLVATTVLYMIFGYTQVAPFFAVPGLLWLVPMFYGFEYISQRRRHKSNR